MAKKNYNIGLDIGTNSIGWAVTDENAHLLKFKGKNMWGVRLFEEGKTAADRRVYRSTRRRYVRRGQRLQFLQKMFDNEIKNVDESFFTRLKESFLHDEDKTVKTQNPLLNNIGISDKDYYKKYPTIYHLRQELMEVVEKMDIRYIYLALHHILKYRGNFLFGKMDFSSIAQNIDEDLKEMFAELILFDDFDVDYDELKRIVGLKCSRAEKQSQLEKLLLTKDKTVDTKIKEIIKALLGYKFSLQKIFDLEEESKTISFQEGIVEEEIVDLLGDKSDVFMILRRIFNWVTLEDIFGEVELDEGKEKTISKVMVNRFDKHKKHLKMLKCLVRKCCQERYNEIFRREDIDNNYVNYIKNSGKNSSEEFNKYIKGILNKYPDAKKHKYYEELNGALNDNKLLLKLRTLENAANPYQLQKMEMEKIIIQQGKHYKFLLENKELLIKMLERKLPYYIGPLSREKIDSEFAWNERLEEPLSKGRVYPWNYEKFIDIDKTAEKFIKRMTNKCTYLIKEDVLPRYSLLYSEFVLLNELNKIKVSIDGRQDTFDQHDKGKIIEEIFKLKKTVKTSDIVSWLERNPRGRMLSKPTLVEIEGTQKENEFAASLISYIDFTKIFGSIDETNIAMIEEIISWITIFEDKDILKRKVKTKYKLSDRQIDRIAKLRYSGWARLSGKLLDGVTALADENYGETIIEIMRKSNLNFMQIITNKKIGFDKIIDEYNSQEKKVEILYEDVKKLQGSPAIKRGIWETVKIIKEISEIMGGQPTNIFMEFARSDEESKRPTSRIKRLEKIYKNITKESEFYNEEVQSNLKNAVKKKEKFDSKALYLYYLQNGKCMYTGESLDLSELSKYEIDHIVPRSYIKDDSIDNTVLVTLAANQAKKDNLLLPPDMQRRQYAFWNHLHQVGLISKKKLDNLQKKEISDHDAMIFINRQLVETRQISKHVSNLFAEVYTDTKIMAIKARLLADFRSQYGFLKNRAVNDFHHAHDALLASVLGNFIIKRFPNWEDELNIKKYVKRARNSNIYTDKRNKYGFIIAEMNKDIDSEDFVWSKDDEITRINKALNYKDVFITKKIEEQTGAFFLETIFSKESKKGKIEIKRGLSVEKYGGYSGVNDAYCVAVEYIDKNKTIKKLVGIPIYKAYEIKNNHKVLFEYLIETLGIGEENIGSLKILRNKIKKYQMLEYKGHLCFLISAKELQNAQQLIPHQRYSKMLHLAANVEEKFVISEEPEVEKLMNCFFEYYAEKIKTHYPYYKSLVPRITDSKEAFLNLNYQDKLGFIKQLLNVTSANSTQVYFKKYGTKLKDGVGRIRARNGCLVKDIVFIDRSVTGLFERRQKL